MIPAESPAGGDVLELDRPEQLKALGHPLRLKILQVLGDSERALTNRELAGALSVDPGHLHFHVRMLHRAGLIELAPAGGREKPYRLVSKQLRVAGEIRASGLATEIQVAQLRDVQRGLERHGAAGDFRSVQMHMKLDADSVRRLFDELIERASELEDESQAGVTITIVAHPSIADAEE